MKKTYEKYQKLNIDASSIEMERGASTSSYFCTPKGATVIGWAGVDGIHFCFIDGFGEMVFAVSPMNTPNDYVHPLARSFSDFLRMLLACGDTAALEQAHGWDELQFNTFLQDYPPTLEQQAVLDTIREQLSLTPMENPFAYIKKLQAEFDGSRLQYKEDCNERAPTPPPAWKVYFSGSFWGHQKRERAGREIILEKQFTWGDTTWYLPAAYSCSKGFVVDLCKQIEPAKIQAFLNKWQNSSVESGEISDETMQQLESENPTSECFQATLLVNGSLLNQSNACAVGWNPCLQDGEENDVESSMILNHYGFDPQMGWLFHRISFPWATKRRPKIKTLSMTLTQDPIPKPGPHFRVSAPGECVSFVDPATGVRHTITIQSYEMQQFSAEQFQDEALDVPRYYTAMCYTLSPDLPENVFAIYDCQRSDAPRLKQPDPSMPLPDGSASIGIIGGADGPTAIFIGGNAPPKQHATFSALHFEPVTDVEWRMEFYEKRRADTTLLLMESEC